MIKSRCHKADLYVIHANEGLSYYHCCQCGRPCETLFRTEHHGAWQHDTRRETKAQAIIGQS